jgi:hypothetical protein
MQSFNTLEIIALICLGLGAVLLPFCRVKAIDRTVNILGLLLMAILIGNEWWLGHWTIGPYLTPVTVIGTDGRHLDGLPNRYGESDKPVFFWFCYLAAAGCLAHSWVGRMPATAASTKPEALTMENVRYEVAVSCSRGIFERLGVPPEAVTPERLSQVVYAVLDAIYDSESRLQEIINPLSRKEQP